MGDGYDAGATGIGRRTSMSDGAGTASYSYDPRGRLIALSRSTAGNPLLTSSRRTIGIILLTKGHPRAIDVGPPPGDDNWVTTE